MLFFFIFSWTLCTHAQQKTLTVIDAMLNNRSTLAPENHRYLQFVKGIDDYFYAKKINGADAWVRGNFMGKEEVSFLTLSQLNKRLIDLGEDSLNALPPSQFNRDFFSLFVNGIKYSFNNNTASYRKMLEKDFSKNKTNMDESSDGYIAYLKDHNLFVSKNGKSHQVTNDGSEMIVYASSVHRDEFGISKGAFWSNNGKLLAFYRMDQSMVTDYFADHLK